MKYLSLVNRRVEINLNVRINDLTDPKNHIANYISVLSLE